MSYDSRPETRKHIEEVQKLIAWAIEDLQDRSLHHDQSKLVDPERTVFDEYTPKLKGSTYGSEEYKGFLEGMGKGLDHHYAHNRHHPEHFARGVDDMTLLDLLEMFLDWKAATMRHDDGDIVRSIGINEKRFGLTPQLARIFRNTVTYLEKRGG